MTFRSLQNRANSISRYWYHPSLGLLVLRTALGTIFFVHGIEKLSHIQPTVLQMSILGLGGEPMAYFVAFLETIGGMALILGVATRVFGALFGIEMLLAAALVGASRGFHGYEFMMLLSASSFAVALMGSGKYSVWALECDKCHALLCDRGEDCKKPK